MRHYVQYRNSDVMGLCEEVNRCRIVTAKPVANLVGQRIWLVCGEGKPRRYFLTTTFVVEDTGPNVEGAFQHFASGPGVLFRPPLRLDHLPWFSIFRERQQNFSLGLREIDPEFVTHFRALVNIAE